MSSPEDIELQRSTYALFVFFLVNLNACSRVVASNCTASAGGYISQCDIRRLTEKPTARVSPAFAMALCLLKTSPAQWIGDASRSAPGALGAS